MHISVIIPTLDNPNDVRDVVKALNLQSTLPSEVVIVDSSSNDEINVFNFSENINIKSNSNSYEQNNYERSIKKNFASSIRDKFIIKIFNLDDN